MGRVLAAFLDADCLVSRYLVKPISMTTRATIETRTELKEFAVPKVDLQISFQEIAFNFHSTQFEQAVAFGSALDQMTVAKEYKKYRPDVSDIHGRVYKLYICAYKGGLTHTSISKRMRAWA